MTFQPPRLLPTEKSIDKTSSRWEMSWPSTTKKLSILPALSYKFQRVIRSVRWRLLCWMARGIWPQECCSPLISQTATAFFQTPISSWSQAQASQALAREAPHNRADYQALRELCHHPSWKVFCKDLRLSRAELHHKLEVETDLLEIARIQGQIKQLKKIEALPVQIERLDEASITGEEYAAAVNKNSR